MVRMIARTLGVSVEVACQRSTQPAHAGIGALDAGRVVVAGAHRRIAVAERGDRALQRVERRLVLAAGGRGVGVQPGERLGGQVGQPGAAVDQQGLAEHAGQLVLAVADLAAVAPAVQHRGRLAQRRLDAPRRRRPAGPGAAG